MTIIKAVGKRFLVFFLALAVMLGLGSWTAPTPGYAAAADGLTIYLVDKAGNDQTLAEWAYDGTQKTFTENGAEVDLVKDFTDPENLTGEINGNVYDFTDEGSLVYTGLNRKPDPRCLSVTTKGILLEDLYDYAEGKAGISLRGDTLMYLSDAGGCNDTFTYDQYWGLDKYYYPEWYAQESYSSEFDFSSATEKYVPATLAITGYRGTTGLTISELIEKADDANSLRITSGLQKNGNRTITEIPGTTYSQGDLNEGMLSVKQVSKVRFTPVYNTITIKDAEETGTAGADLTAKVANATVSTSDNYFKAAEGETVDLSVTPDEGCIVNDVSVTDADDAPVEVTEKDGIWSFSMPSSAVTVSVKAKNEFLWDGGLDFRWYDENNVKSEYHISTPEQWEAIAWICSEHLADLADYQTNTNGNVTEIKGSVPSEQNTFDGVQFYLDNDIDMGGVKADDGTWSGPVYYPIGSQGMKDTTGNFYGVFNGSFDGQGHYVTNVYAERGSGQSYQAVGLFGRVGAPDDAASYPANDITIENIGVSGYIHGGRSVGGIVGKTLHVASGHIITIKNCVNHAEVSSTDKKGLGGICGAFWYAPVMENCYSTGSINGEGRPKGAVVGGNEGTITNVYSTQDLPVTGENATASASVTNGYSLASATIDEMINPSFAAALGDGFKASCGTPVLAWEEAAEHDLQKTEAKDVTCTEDGNIAFWTCSECGLVFCDEGKTVINAEETVIPALGHEYDLGVITKQPTDTEDGEITYTCSRCGGTYIEAINMEYMAGIEALKDEVTDKVIAANQDLATGEYTEDSVEALKEAIKAANDIIDDETATEASIKAAKAELMQAWRTMEPVDKAAKQEIADYIAAYDSLLETMINVYNNVTPSAYTTGSYAVLQLAMNEAEALIDDPDADSSLLAAAKTDILLAQKNLIKKYANTMTVKTAARTVKFKKVKAKKQVVKAITVKKAKGKVTYTKASGSAKLTVNKTTGKITVKKGTKKGTYKAKVKVKAPGNGNYKALTKTVTVTIKVK